MDIENLFLQTLADLESRAAANDPYTILLASGLIRKLFLDGGGSLVDQVNRIYRLRLEFETIDTDQMLSTFDAAGIPRQSLELLAVGDTFDPDLLPNAPRKTMNRDAFFGTEIQVSEGSTFTVREIIRHQAHIRGGIHADAPSDDREEALSKTEDTVKILGMPPGIRHLRAISRVVLKALNPLRVVVLCSKAIESDPDNIVAYYNRGSTYSGAGKLQEAIDDLSRAIEIDPDHTRIADAYYNRGHTFAQLMASKIEESAMLCPGSPERQRVEEEIEKAAAQIIHDYGQCLELDPDCLAREQMIEVIEQLRLCLARDE